MRCKWLGWAGVEIESGEDRLVIDPLGDPAALYAVLGDAAANVELPPVVQAASEPPAIAALLTHLHRDHADAGALAAVLGEGAPVLLPAADAWEGAADTAIRQATKELAAADVELRPIAPWETFQAGEFAITALPAADGTGDPQVSWAVEADGARIVHCGDTLFHGWLWRAALRAGPFDLAFLPINGAVVDFPWRQPPSPLPAVMTPEQAVVAARALGARRAVPMHFDGFDLDPYYASIPNARERFLAAARDADLGTVELEVGEAIEVAL